MKFTQDKRWIWIILGGTTLLLRATASPEHIEHFYSRSIFIIIRKIIDSFAQFLPFALVYLLFIALVISIIQLVRKSLKDQRSLKKKLINALFSTVSFLFAIIFLFLFLWGFNYGRIPLEKQMDIEPQPLSLTDLKHELDSTTQLLHQYRKTIYNISDSAITASFLPPNIETEMRDLLKLTLSDYDYPIPSDVRGRLLYPKGILLRISTAGVYIPFTGEGHIDAGLHPLQIPFVIAHEMSHAYGFGDEGTCNFLAYLACLKSDKSIIRYIGLLSYWRYVASNYRRYAPKEYADFYHEVLDIGVKKDLQAIYHEMDKYPDILPKFRDAVYNNYLKVQGIEEGIQNYSRILMLVKAYKKKAFTEKN